MSASAKEARRARTHARGSTSVCLTLSSAKRESGDTKQEPRGEPERHSTELQSFQTEELPDGCRKPGELSLVRKTASEERIDAVSCPNRLSSLSRYVELDSIDPLPRPFSAWVTSKETSSLPTTEHLVSQPNPQKARPNISNILCL